jgi:hypothetical protein
MRILSTLIAISLLVNVPVFAGRKKELPPVQQIVKFSDLTIDQTQELFTGQLPDVAILCEEGFEFPLKYIAKFGFATATLVPNLKIRVDRSCYFRGYGNKVYMSYDLVEWGKPEFPTRKTKVSAGFTPNKSEFLIQVDPDLRMDEEIDEEWDD